MFQVIIECLLIYPQAHVLYERLDTSMVEILKFKDSRTITAR